MKNEFLILGGDLNFSLGEAESWCPSSHPYNQASFFSHLLSSNGLIDIAPLKLLPTWRNMKVGEARISKRLDHFLISETLAMLPFQFRQWIGSGGESDHLVWLEIEGGPQNPVAPFKFNYSWLKDESFQNFLKSNWNDIRDSEGSLTAIQFAKNIKRIKSLLFCGKKQNRKKKNKNSKV
jgi:hypothetical protein